VTIERKILINFVRSGYVETSRYTQKNRGIERFNNLLYKNRTRQNLIFILKILVKRKMKQGYVAMSHGKTIVSRARSG